MDTLIKSLVQAKLDPERIIPRAIMARYTTFHIGGPADVLVNIAAANEIPLALRAAKQAGVPVTLIGNGSNVLVRDGGIRGLVIRIDGSMAAIRQEGDTLHVQSGALIRAAANFAMNEGLSGLEEVAGIPGTIGGGVIMNAGAYGIRVGTMTPGPLDRITDVPGVTVGHATIRDEKHNTGVTVIMPCQDNMFSSKLVAASFVLNGFGKTQGLIQVDELGTLETPIALTNTLNVGVVHDALVSYMAKRCEADGIAMRSLNPVVGECNDAGLSTIVDRPVTAEHVFAAIESADVLFEEGGVGAGAGTICHGLKGGIGSSSRIIEVGEERFTLGILVQSNYGGLAELTIGGRPVGQEILKARAQEAEKQAMDRGSIMMIAATDMPVSDRQLRRILKRCGAGLARLGSYYGHGSGDVMIGFSTANRIPHGHRGEVLSMRMVTEETLESAFRAAAEATEEAVLNSLCAAEDTKGPTGRVVEAIGKYV